MPILPLSTVVAGIVGGFTGAAAEEGLAPLTVHLQDWHRYILLFVLLAIVGYWLLTHPSGRRRR
jgi:hypothetical protein